MSIKKVIIIDDSAFMRKVISDIINQDPHLEVVATARNGQDGLKKVQEYKPDVITLDIEMPVMDGLKALKEIMAEHPTPVIMLSSLTYEGAEATIEALELGAVDFINKTSGSISLDINDISEEICRKVKDATSAMVEKPKSHNHTVSSQKRSPNFVSDQTIITIGVSTGGPKALQQLLSKLPGDFKAPILIVQHMPAAFTKSLAERLDRLSEINVKEAVNGELIKPGTAYIAPGDYHLSIKSVGRAYATVIDQTEPIRGHRPSVNKLFESVADLNRVNKVGVILTGMGNDGTLGAQMMREKDRNTYLIAESEQSAVIYGMPKSIIENVDPDLIEPIDSIPSSLIKLFNHWLC
ncbi:chemotaxis response regulator protein-glutamate methylesterase [Alkalibacillus silvisoli]|uniref:Protein-glutamate methylesterase/protein-glutamine glutaminase n=1 Tax=Alkalibacillus silvisoli TaxID=392823 RepID=A0ABN0ZWJ4_9BACI